MGSVLSDTFFKILFDYCKYVYFNIYVQILQQLNF
jgi:hypothetical protein